MADTPIETGPTDAGALAGLLSDINRAAHASGTNAWVRDVLTRAHRAVRKASLQETRGDEPVAWRHHINGEWVLTAEPMWDTSEPLYAASQQSLLGSEE